MISTRSWGRLSRRPRTERLYPRTTMSEPDLFVVCKNCSAEVSPYVTECPYCGQRVRKRAPKLDKGGTPPEPKRQRRPRAPKLPRLRGGEIPGIAPDTRPRATILLITLSILLYLAVVAGVLNLFDVGIYFKGEEPWKYVTTTFFHDNLGYAVIALITVGIFGTHLERRFGLLTPVLIFLTAGVAGAAASDALQVYPAIGANGAAMGLLVAWLVEDRRSGVDRENDLLGVYVIAAAVLLCSAATREASIVAAVAGAGVGAAWGLLLPALIRRSAR